MKKISLFFFVAFLILPFLTLSDAQAARPKIVYTFYGDSKGGSDIVPNDPDQPPCTNIVCNGVCCAAGEHCDGTCATCPPGQYWLNASCECSDNTKIKNGVQCVECVVTLDCKNVNKICVNNSCVDLICPADQYIDNGVCVCNDPNRYVSGATCVCNVGLSESNGHCCPTGWLWNGYACVTCRPDQEYVGGTCKCPDGQSETNGHCCPNGQTWNENLNSGAGDCAQCRTDDDCLITPSTPECSTSGICIPPSNCSSPRSYRQKNGIWGCYCPNDDVFVSAHNVCCPSTEPVWDVVLNKCVISCDVGKKWMEESSTGACCIMGSEHYSYDTFSSSGSCCAIGLEWSRGSTGGQCCASGRVWTDGVSTGGCCFPGDIWLDGYGCVECWDNIHCPTGSCDLNTYTCCTAGTEWGEDSSYPGPGACCSSGTQYYSYSQQAYSGSCCATGTFWNGSSCVSCRPDQVRSGDTCQCPSGFTEDNGHCCANGSFWNGVQCLTCPPDKERSGNACICKSGTSDPQGCGICCAPSQFANNAICQNACRADQILTGPACYQICACPAGQSESNGHCCPNGQTWNGTVCAVPVPVCYTKSCNSSFDCGGNMICSNKCCECPYGWVQQGSDCYDPNNYDGGYGGYDPWYDGHDGYYGDDYDGWYNGGDGGLGCEGVACCHYIQCANDYDGAYGIVVKTIPGGVACYCARL